ncbi:hypothetical protein PRUPE_8G141100 [Prunus persica]|uniref:Transcriptional coactivator Hfi1/Transcriptional adapter 1 n=1 Tax=Prunus persica TaxID=3760 RepID=M5W4S4_PRUPE|nr:uncharacterized protein LOC18767357 [Prunus persica]ONH91872.1 hypothetical protein PRUPE_8G141100 [Prunus persica]
MVPNQSYTRIDTLELKGLIIQRIGHQRAEKYFDLIRRLFSSKISKCEFDKFCNRTIGRENVHLHNRLIKSIIKNACLAKVPPLTGIKKGGSTLNVKVANGCQKNGFQSVNADAFPQSPRKGRSPVNRERKFRDRPSPLGPNGKPQNLASEEFISKALEQQSASELLSLGSRPPVEVASVEDGEEVEQDAGSPSIQSRSPVTAPLGINLGGSRKALPNVSLCSTYHPETCQNCGELPDTRSLRSRLERKLELEGVSVSVDCVNLLNNGLDAYLKRLIEPCIQLAGTRHGNEHLKQLSGSYPYKDGLNGMSLPRNMQRERKSTYVTVSDFSTSVELNPQILGADWAIQREKIVLCASEE